MEVCRLLLHRSMPENMDGTLRNSVLQPHINLWDAGHKPQVPNFLPMTARTSAFEEIYASPSTPHASLPCSTPNDSASLNFIRRIVANFVEGLDYCPSRRDPIVDIRTTYESVCSEFASYNDGGAWFEAFCRDSSSAGVVRDFYWKWTCIGLKPEIYSFPILITRHKFSFKSQNSPGTLSPTPSKLQSWLMVY